MKTFNAIAGCILTGSISFFSMFAHAVEPAEASLTRTHAQRLIAPFYDALTRQSKSEIESLLRSITTPAWVSCGGNDACQPRELVIERWSGRGSSIPDLRWEQKELLVAGNKIIVRGEESGTPAGEFQGVPHGGKSFRIMSIDIHTMVGGKIVRTHHVEDWASARRQLAAD